MVVATYDVAIITGLIGSAAVLAYLAVRFDERYKPIKMIFLFSSLFLILSIANQSLEILALQDDSVTANCTDNNPVTSCTAFNDLISLNTGLYKMILGLSIAAMLLYFAYYVWDLFLQFKINRRIKKDEMD